MSLDWLQLHLPKKSGNLMRVQTHFRLVKGNRVQPHFPSRTKIRFLAYDAPRHPYHWEFLLGDRIAEPNSSSATAGACNPQVEVLVVTVLVVNVRGSCEISPRAPRPDSVISCAKMTRRGGKADLANGG